MEKRGLGISGTELTAGSKPVILRGAGFGNYMNIEHFMFGFPGTENRMRAVIKEVYGDQNASLFWNRFHNAFLDDEDLAWVRELGLNAIRLPMNYRHFESDDSPGKYRPEGFALLDRALKLAERHQLYIILDMHAAPGGQNPDWHCDNDTGMALFWEHRICQERLISLWKAIARRCRDNPWVAGYDLLNEPVPPDRRISGQQVNQFNHAAASEIRSVDKNHILFIEGDFYAQDTTNFTPLNDPLVAYSLHYYPFFNRDNLTAALKEPSEPDRVERMVSGIRNSVSVDDIRSRLGRPVWCGETGIPSGTAEPEGMVRMLSDTLKALEKEKISWSLWNGKDARAMGLLRPAKDSPWMELCRKIKPSWNIGSDMESARRESEALVERWDPEPERRETVIRDIQFRLMAMNQAGELVKLEKVLKKTPFPELLRAVESFRFENCEIWTEAADCVTGVTGPLKS